KADLEYKSLNNELQIYESSVKHQEEEKEGLLAHDQELEKQALQIEESLSTIEKDIDDLTKKEASLKREESATRDLLHKLEIKLAEKDEQIKNEKTKVYELNIQLKDVKNEEKKLIKEQAELNKIEESKREKERTETLIKEHMSSRDLIETELKDIQKKRLLLSEK